MLLYVIAAVLALFRADDVQSSGVSSSKLEQELAVQLFILSVLQLSGCV